MSGGPKAQPISMEEQEPYILVGRAKRPAYLIKSENLTYWNIGKKAELVDVGIESSWASPIKIGCHVPTY